MYEHTSSPRTALHVNPPEPARSVSNRDLSHVYERLHRLAVWFLRHERPDPMVEPDMLVHEAMLRLHLLNGRRPFDEQHVLAAAACTMRHVLIDYGRRRTALSRAAERHGVPANNDADWAGHRLEILALLAALARLAAFNRRQARVVKLKFVGGLSVKDIAHVLHVSPRTVKDDWHCARAWLQGQLLGQSGRNGRKM